MKLAAVSPLLALMLARQNKKTALACAQLIVYLAGSLVAGMLADLMGYGLLFSLATAISLLALGVTAKLLLRQ